MFQWINKKRNKKGFTLVELVVVIAILGILAAIAIPRFTGMRHEATVKSEGTTAASIISAARVQEAENGMAVGDADGEIVANGTPAADKGLIDTKFMIIPGAPQYTIKRTGNLYEVTWTTKAGGAYSTKSQTLTEGTAFTPNNS